MTRLNLDEIKKNHSFIDGSLSNLDLNVNRQDLDEIINIILDPSNCRQLSFLQEKDIALLSILDAYANANDEYDIDNFYRNLVENIFVLSSSINGNRSNQIQNIIVGQMNREYALELARVRSGDVEENKNLKDVI